MLKVTVLKNKKKNIQLAKKSKLNLQYCGRQISETNELLMINFACGMVDGRKTISLISSRDHCQRPSLLKISHTPRAGYELGQSSELKLCSSDNLYTTVQQSKIVETNSRVLLDINKIIVI